MTRTGLTRRALIGSVAAGAGVLAAPSVGRTQTREFRMGTPFVNGSNLHQGMLKFAETVLAGSNGRLKINVYSDSQIGDIQALLSGMQLGTVDMAYLGIGNGERGRDPEHAAHAGEMDDVHAESKGHAFT